MTQAQLQVQLRLIDNCKVKERQEKERHEKALKAIDKEWVRLVEEIAPISSVVVLDTGAKGFVLGYKGEDRRITLATPRGKEYDVSNWSFERISVFPKKEVAR